MNSLGILFYSFLFAFNQFYHLVAPLFSIELIEGGPTSKICEGFDTFQTRILDPIQDPLFPVTETGMISVQVRLLLALIVVLIVVHLFKATSLSMSSQYLHESIPMYHGLNSVTGNSDDYIYTELEEDIFQELSHFYPTMSMRFNGTIQGQHTMLSRPTDLLMWDSKTFSPS